MKWNNLIHRKFVSINKYSRLSDYDEDTFRQYGNVIEFRCVVLNVVFTEKLAEAKANQISRPKCKENWFIAFF